MRLLNGFLAILSIAGAVSAQPPSISAQETQRARQLLNSSGWAERAWGAYFAGRLHSADLDQTLVEQFRLAAPLRNASFRSGEHAFVAALFDAAIEAGVTIPSTVLDPFVEKWADPVMILLARGKDSDEILLRLRVDESRPAIWLAANNLLFERKSQAWFSGLLGELSITHRFFVTTPGSGGGMIGSGHGGVEGVSGGAPVPSGFPPIGFYRLQDGRSARRGSILLARGPENVYYRRAVSSTDRQVDVGYYGADFDLMSVRLGYLAQLTFRPQDQVERLFHAETNIQYTTAEDIARQANQNMEAQEQRIRDFFQHIETAGLSAGNIHLEIVPKIVDLRQEPQGALPVLQPRGFDLRQATTPE